MKKSSDDLKDTKMTFRLVNIDPSLHDDSEYNNDSQQYICNGFRVEITPQGAMMNQADIEELIFNRRIEPQQLGLDIPTSDSQTDTVVNLLFLFGGLTNYHYSAVRNTYLVLLNSVAAHVFVEGVYGWKLPRQPYIEAVRHADTAQVILKNMVTGVEIPLHPV